MSEYIAEKEGWYDRKEFVSDKSEELMDYIRNYHGKNWIHALAVWVSEDPSSESIIARMMRSIEPTGVAEDAVLDCINNSGRVFEFDGVIFEYRLEGDDLDEEVMV